MNAFFRAATLAMALLAAVTVSSGPARAQSDEPAPVVIVGNASFTPLYERVMLAPGERQERDLGVGGFGRASILALAESGPNTGQVVVQALFGPPDVPAGAPLVLAFGGRPQALGGSSTPVMGPHMTVSVLNRTTQPVAVTLSVYAVK